MQRTVTEMLITWNSPLLRFVVSIFQTDFTSSPWCQSTRLGKYYGYLCCWGGGGGSVTKMPGILNHIPNSSLWKTNADIEKIFCQSFKILLCLEIT